MKAGWAAGGVRARAMARRRYGAAAATSLASCESLDQALERLATTPYGHGIRPGMPLVEAQHAVVATTLWHCRVLGGWVPTEGVQLLRVVAAGLEIANVDRLLRSFSDDTAAEVTLPAYQLGTLGTAWPRLEHAGSASALRALLAESPWGDPGHDSPWAIRLWMRLSWAHRAVASMPTQWVLGATALLVARERFAAGHGFVPAAQDIAESLLGDAAMAEGSLPRFVAALPRDAGWALEGVTGTGGLWLAEAGWWRQVERDSFRDLHRGLLEPATLVGAVGVLAVDAWRVRAALEVAARGGAGREVFDVVA
ncbi:hypothetical protein [Nocardioides dilutus]